MKASMIPDRPDRISDKTEKDRHLKPLLIILDHSHGGIDKSLRVDKRFVRAVMPFVRMGRREEGSSSVRLSVGRERNAKFYQRWWMRWTGWSS
jgi:hypothetical protein